MTNITYLVFLPLPDIRGSCRPLDMRGSYYWPPRWAPKVGLRLDFGLTPRWIGVIGAILEKQGERQELFELSSAWSVEQGWVGVRKLTRKLLEELLKKPTTFLLTSDSCFLLRTGQLPFL